MIKRILSPSEIEDRRGQQIQGIGSETLLRVLDPIIDVRINALQVELFQAKPELNTLLDIRARLAELVRIKAELVSVKSLGKEAGDALTAIFQ